MIRIARAADYSPQILAMSPDFMDWPYLSKILGDFPQNIADSVAESYREKRQNAGQAGANEWIREDIAERLNREALALSASDSELRKFADDCVRDVREMLMNCNLVESEGLRGALLTYAKNYGASIAPDMPLQFMVARLTDSKFWRRQLRRKQGRDVEGVARQLGLVSKIKGIYASDETVARHQEQKRRNLAALEETEATSSEGETFSMATLAALGVSNPSVRFAELMVRVRGMEAHAARVGDAALFVTGTAPSEMHATKSDGQQNMKFDGTDPQAAQQWLTRQWSRIRAALARLNIAYYGVRVAEPHHDGTPHWHLLVFMPERFLEAFKGVFKFRLIRGDWTPSKKKDLVKEYRKSGMTIRAAGEKADAILAAELAEKEAAERGDEARQQHACHFERITAEKGTPAGYLVKYLAKNISGERVGAPETEKQKAAAESEKPASKTATRVLAWASCWGIRQFQIVGGPPVGVWRELRRLKDEPEQLELFDAWHAVGRKEAIAGPLLPGEKREFVQVVKPDWCAFIEAQGGMNIKQKDRPVHLWFRDEPGRVNQYGEPTGARVAGVSCAGVVTETRTTVWTIHRKGASPVKVDRVIQQGRRASPVAPRTRVNNCTQTAFQGIAANLAGWEKAGFRGAVIEIFNQLRRLKNAGNSGRCGIGMEQSADACKSDGRAIRRANFGGAGRNC